MAIRKTDFARLVRSFEFREVFVEMGWNRDTTPLPPIVIDGETFKITSVAEKSGFKIVLCDCGKLPDYGIRKKLESKVTKLFQEHLIIFVEASRSIQIWQMVLREQGKPSKLTETRYAVTQDPELLYQRASGLLFTIDEEDNVTIVDVKRKVASNFQANAEKVTKKFYSEFKAHHTAFLKFIDGIEERVDKEWYASLMLNRLMFCYFIQKKGFLDNNKNYLNDKLAESKKHKKDKFYSFYRNFLLVLFHKGLGQPDHDEKLKKEIGRIPYLNGGLFDVHELEVTYKDIAIEDKAFDRIFTFFDEWEWHLDTSINASGKEVNPDVIGYIFEKYINDRADMGAYYTKEDITDYISKNCIIPWLFDEVQRNYPAPLKEKGEVWEMVRQSGDKYIYDAVKYGIPAEGLWHDLPKDVKVGLNPDQKDLLEKRKCWNRPAPAEAALPTEIWREVIDRRKRYEDILSKITSGSITQINDFITYNLNIRQLIQDVIENTPDPELIKHFYKAISGITILDPTCGSGAFLFAALNILEPLYESCIMRMRSFTEDEDKFNAKEKDTFRHKHKFFRDVLTEVQNPQHPNLSYFIYKSIILRNLHGVDIMREAVEIAKLRLFLKLVATVDPDYRKNNLGLEPLPDVDFNIRSGNTLIGFASEHELKKAFEDIFDFDNAFGKVQEECELVSKAFEHYKVIQLSKGDNYNEFKKAKDELNKRLKRLNAQLDILLHKQYSAIKYEKWKNTHQPFHWFAEYYEIICGRGGFDVIIGNPPYVEYNKVKGQYSIQKKYTTEKCGNLYPYVIEIANSIISKKGIQGFIIPLSGFCTQRMEPLVNFYKKLPNRNWISHFGWRPATLFEGVNIPLSMIISTPNSTKEIQITRFEKWYREKREVLFNLINYTRGNDVLLHQFVFPKIEGSNISIISKLLRIKNNIGKYITPKSKHLLYYRNTGGLYWRIIINFSPTFKLNGVKSASSTLNSFHFLTEEYLQISIALLNSNLFWMYYVAFSSFHHVNPIDITSFPVDIDKMPDKIRKSLSLLASKLMANMIDNSTFEMRVHKGGNNSQSQTFYPSLSKHIVDEIDMVLAQYYNFNNDEVDKIINYDVIYRTQKDGENE